MKELVENTIKKYKVIIVLMFLIFITIMVILKLYLKNIYMSAVELYNKGAYSEAIEKFTWLGDYKDSYDYIDKAHKQLTINENEGKLFLEERDLESEKLIYEKAIAYYDEGDYEKAIELFILIEDYEDSYSYLQMAIEKKDYKVLYEKAIELKNEGDVNNALSIFESLNDYKNSRIYLEECKQYSEREKNSKRISAGIQFSAAVDDNGRVLYSGSNMRIKAEVEKWEDIVSVSAFGELVAGLDKEGFVHTALGRNLEYKVNTDDWNNIIEITTGDLYVVGLRADGTLTAQGHNGDGQLDIDDWERIIKIDAGWRHTVAIDSAGKVHISGLGSEKQMEEIKNEEGMWNNIVDISAGGGENSYGYTVALRDDGTVVAVGNNNYGQCNVDDWKDVISISAGDFYTVGLKQDGSVISTSEELNQKISNWDDIVAISAGYNYLLAVNSDGYVYGTGLNEMGIKEIDKWNLKIVNE